MEYHKWLKFTVQKPLYWYNRYYKYTVFGFYTLPANTSVESFPFSLGGAHCAKSVQRAGNIVPCIKKNRKLVIHFMKTVLWVNTSPSPSKNRRMVSGLVPMYATYGVIRVKTAVNSIPNPIVCFPPNLWDKTPPGRCVSM